jgi:hypothetical protein
VETCPRSDSPKHAGRKTNPHRDSKKHAGPEICLRPDSPKYAGRKINLRPDSPGYTGVDLWFVSFGAGPEGIIGRQRMLSVVTGVVFKGL